MKSNNIFWIVIICVIATIIGLTYLLITKITSIAQDSNFSLQQELTEAKEILSGEINWTEIKKEKNDKNIIKSYRYAPFTVDENKRAYFAKGNLQYQASTNTWRFANNQWEIIGNDNQRIGKSDTTWIDIFGWGTSGYDGILPTNHSTNLKDYAPDKRNIAKTQYDWGMYNPIEEKERVTSWRTPLRSEILYLLTKRPNAALLNFHAQINGTNGIVILPDNLDYTKLVEYKIIDSKVGRKNLHIFTIEEWREIEYLGAVFLPMAGSRKGTKVTIDKEGLYWLSSHKDSDKAYSLVFSDENIRLRTIERYQGLAVRLIRTAPNK